MRRPRPSTLVWRSLVDVLLGGGFLDGSAASIWRLEDGVVDLGVVELGFEMTSVEMAREG